MAQTLNSKLSGEYTRLYHQRETVRSKPKLVTFRGRGRCFIIYGSSCIVTDSTLWASGGKPGPSPLPLSTPGSSCPLF